MKLTRQTVVNAHCPVCALGGWSISLTMKPDNLEVYCMNGHRFDTVELSKLFEKVGKRDPKTEIKTG